MNYCDTSLERKAVFGWGRANHAAKGGREGGWRLIADREGDVGDRPRWIRDHVPKRDRVARIHRDRVCVDPLFCERRDEIAEAGRVARGDNYRPAGTAEPLGDRLPDTRSSAG